ncbi:Endonuclease/exonuclease/phosphatase, partial [Trametes polyzona]
MCSSLHVVFQNVNHSPHATHMLLERCAVQDVDIVCIQEPWYGPIRSIPSATPAGPAERTDDNMLYSTQIHSAWSLIEARKNARVACHVSRRLVNAVVSLSAAVDHHDCMLLPVRLDAEQEPIAILNIYNNQHNTAVEYLAVIINALPPIDIAGGDYNTHSHVWEPRRVQVDSAAQIGEVLDLHAHLGLRLLSPVGVPIDERPKPSVLDLVWVPNDRPPQLFTICIVKDERGPSDHFVIHVTIPTREWSLEGPPDISPKSEAEKAFLSNIHDSVATRLPPGLPLDSADDLCAAVDVLFECVWVAWDAYARPIVLCDKSRLWWDESCSAARNALNDARCRLFRAQNEAPQLVPSARAVAKRAFNRLKSTMRARHRAHFDERIQDVAVKQR